MAGAIVSVIELLAVLFSGLVSFLVLGGAAVDAIFGGVVQRKVRGWLGLTEIQRTNQATQIFLSDLARAHNELVDVIAEENGRPRPSKIDVKRYERLLDRGVPLVQGAFIKEASEEEE